MMVSGIGGSGTGLPEVLSSVRSSFSFSSRSLVKIAFTFRSRETKYFRSPDFPIRVVPNSPGEWVAVPSQEKGCRPYSSPAAGLAEAGDGDNDKLPEVDT